MIGRRELERQRDEGPSGRPGRMVSRALLEGRSFREIFAFVVRLQIRGPLPEDWIAAREAKG
jgi:hypothetical protein